MGESTQQEATASAARLDEDRLDEGRLAWLALALTPGLGPKRILDAAKQAGSASRVLELG